MEQPGTEAERKAGANKRKREELVSELLYQSTVIY